MTPIVASLSLLTPYDIDLPKVRIGPRTDGGYVFAGEPRPEQTVLSYGISTEYRFDEEMARRGHRVHMFDHTIEPLTPSDPNMIFHSEGVAGISNPERRLFSVADHLDRFDIRGNDLILKIDVEGCEYETFKAMPASVLTRFEQIVMEVHDISNLADESFRAKFDAVFKALNEHFTLFHVHANNFDGDRLFTVGGLPVAALMEFSYVRTSRVRRSRNTTLYPTALDYPCIDRRDKLLWFYPFMPSTVAPSAFEASDERLERLSRRTETFKAKADREFDADWYRQHYRDLRDCSTEFLTEHFYKHGIGEGRLGSARELETFDHAC